MKKIKIKIFRYNIIMEVEGVERFKKTEFNGYKYSSVEIAKRQVAIKNMKRDFPNVAHNWVEMIYDVISNMDEKKVEEIINTGVWEKKESKFSKALGGSFDTCEILESV
jgi:hypothetical protein